jgi:hypothetical protein
MDNKLDEMIALIKDAQTALNPYQESLKDPILTGLSHPERILSNFDLLCKTLLNFYSKDNRASYLPMSINKELQTELINLKGNLTQATQDKLTPAAAQGILGTLDSCYAISLKYGLITFGFDQRNIQTLVTSANGMHAKISEMGSQAEQKVKEFDGMLINAHDKALGIYDDLVKKVASDLEVRISTANESIEKAKKAYQELESKIATTGQVAAGAQEQFAKVQETSTLISKTQAQLTQDYETLKTTLSESRAILDNVKETRLGMKTQFDNIQEFYGEIEAHKKKIADIKKDADESFNKLTEQSSKSVLEYTNLTRDIVDKNRKLQTDIVAHLRKAISGTLFSAFSVRSGRLSITKWGWAAILAGCVVVGVWLTITIAHDLSGVPNRAFFVKLSAMLPILYLLVFSSKQYSNERRTEEEYAFKSAISISLESYRELLERITKEQGAEAAAYVKKLIDEIFDNPVKRIYPPKETLEEAKEDNLINLKEIVGSLSNNSTDQIKMLIEFLKQAMAVIKPK